MNRKLIFDALDMLDDEYIEEFIARRSKSAPVSSERKGNMNTGFTAKRRKIIIAIAVAACIALSVCIAASAANLWGIRDLFSASGKELPEQADQYITPQSVSIQDGDWSIRVTESLCSGRTLSVAVEITASDKYILIDADSDPEDHAASLGIDFDGTLSQYAAAQGKELVNVSAIVEAKDTPWLTGTLHFERVSDNAMVILAQSTAQSEITATEGICRIYALGRQFDADFEISTLDSHSSLFICTAPSAMPGVIFGSAKVTEDDLGIDITIEETVTDYDTFSLMEMRFNDISDLYGGSLHESGNKWTLDMFDGQGTVGDTLTLSIYNVENGQFMGEVLFERVKDE